MQGALWCQRLGVSENVTACLQETHRSMQPARDGHSTMLLYGNRLGPAGLRVAERRGPPVDTGDPIGEEAGHAGQGHPHPFVAYAMHELGIASAILERAQATSERNGNARVLKIGLRIGEVSGVEPDALSFAIEALAKGTSCEGVVLDVERPRRRRRCGACGAEFELDGMIAACPMCRRDASECVAGSELDLTYIELEDPPCA
jgi:hydrogenase nickel incorporation protein HypA/HybF